MWIELNSSPISPSVPALPVGNRAFLFGEGIFETLRADGGKISFLKEHLDRLYRSARFFEIPLPTRQSLTAQVTQRVAQLAYPLASVKLVASASGESLRLPQAVQEAPSTRIPQLLLTVSPAPLPSARDYRSGIAWVEIKGVKGELPPLSSHKTTASLTHLLARRELAKTGAFEGVLESPHGFISEGTASNLFWVKGGIVYTPALASGCLPGVTRRAILVLCRRHSLPHREVLSPLQAIAEAEEAWMANSLIEILPAVSLNGKTIGRGKPGPFYKKIQQLYRDMERY